MKFGNPIWLWGLLLLPLAYLLLVFDEKRRQGQFAQFADKKLWSFIAPEVDWASRLRKGRTTLLAFGFLLLALARPQFGTHEETVQVSGLDIMLALDVSNSMDVEDVVPSRLLKAKHVIRSIVERLGGDRVGVVAFAYSSYVACPLTTNLDYLLDTIQILSPKTIQNQGTDIGSALETAFKALDRGAEEITNAHPGGVSSRVIILLSDGEDHEDQAIKEAVKMKNKGSRLYVLGIGTEAGGPIPMKEDGQSQGFKRDRNGKPVISTFRPDFLANLASAAGGKYWTVTAGETEVQELLSDLGALDRSDYTERRYLVYEDRFQIPLLIAIFLFLLEISLPARKVLACFPVFLGMGIGLGWPSQASADDLLKKPAPLGSYLDNQKGLDAFKEGRMEDAQKEFGAAQAQDPSRPELEFNQGVVHMQKGDVDRAIEAFQNSSRGALDKQNQTLLGKSFFNLGNAYAKKGDLKSAVRSYREAISFADQTKNQALEDKARKNLQLLLNEKKKQQEQQKQDQQKQEQQQQQKKEQDKQQQAGSEKDPQKSGQDKQDKQGKEEPGKEDKKDDQKQKSGGEENPPNQEAKKESGKPQFNSKKMDPQDAERVLSELTSRERELQEKLNKQNARVQNNPQDW